MSCSSVSQPGPRSPGRRSRAATAPRRALRAAGDRCRARCRRQRVRRAPRRAPAGSFCPRGRHHRPQASAVRGRALPVRWARSARCRGRRRRTPSGAIPVERCKVGPEIPSPSEGSSTGSGRSDGDVICLGAGGTTVALAHHLFATRPGVRFVCADRLPDAVDRVARIVGQPVAAHIGSGPWDHLIEGAPAGSFIVNATGLGKDRPGSPTSDDVQFPPSSVVWDLNYRGDLRFLQQAERQACLLDVHDGWELFCQGWAAALSVVLDLPDDAELGDRFREAAHHLRPTANMTRSELGRARVGCSGWMYKTGGIVYPAELPQRGGSSTTQSSSTPSSSTPPSTGCRRRRRSSGWAAQAPPGFVYAREARPVRLAPHEAARRRVVAAEPPRPGRAARAAPRPDARAAAAALEAQRRAARRVPRGRARDDALGGRAARPVVAARRRVRGAASATAPRCASTTCSPDHPWELTTDWTYVRFHGPDALEREVPRRVRRAPAVAGRRAVAAWLDDGVDVYALLQQRLVRARGRRMRPG